MTEKLTITLGQIYDGIIATPQPTATIPEPSAWCAVDEHNDIQFLSKAKHRADIFAEGTKFTVEPLYRSGEATTFDKGRR